MTNLPPLPTLTKAERRKTCGACGADIRGNRKGRSSGICSTCQWSVETRGRPLVPETDCKCKCTKHQRFMCVDDGQCGSPVGGRREPDCCFSGEDNGDSAFRALFNEHEKAFLAAAKQARDESFAKFDKERRERWAREDSLKAELPGPTAEVHVIKDEVFVVTPVQPEYGRDPLIKSTEIIARPRRVKANWKQQALDDLNKLMGDTDGR